MVITFFDDLSDLSLLEIFSYLSCMDALWAFGTLNTRLTTLLIERGFFRHVNLSSSRYYQFETLLPLLRLNEIHSLMIDYNASPLQLSKWPYLPHLKTLGVKGIYDYFDICHFVLQHAKSLVHLIVESSGYHRRIGATKRSHLVTWTLETLEDFMKKILQRLPSLRLLDFGTEPSFFLSFWSLETIRTPLTYLRITSSAIIIIIRLMLTQPLRHTLQQFHVQLNDINSAAHLNLSHLKLLPRMEALHTFTFVKSFNWHFRQEWTFLDTLTSSSVMPVLQRTNFAIVINVDDFIEMNRSALFTDYRHTDVQYAFIVNNYRSHNEISKCLPCGSQYHARPTASATFISECWPDNQLFTTPGQYYWQKPQDRHHLFYTLPWIFNELFPFCVPDRCINELQIFQACSATNKIDSSRLVKMNMSDNILGSAALLAHLMFSDQIVELQLFRCDRQISFSLPKLTHLTLIDSLDALNTRSMATNIRSIQIILHHECLAFASNDWTALRTLSTLPLLCSLRVLLYNMLHPPDDKSCEVIAETALTVVDFGFCFRRRSDRYIEHNYDNDSIYTEHSLFIERLRNCIVTLSLTKKLYVVVDEDGCGIFLWF